MSEDKLVSVSVRGYANIAFIKYWGQKNSNEVLPYNDSFSMNLSNCWTDVYCDWYNDKNIRKIEYKNKNDENYKEFSQDHSDSLSKFINLLAQKHNLKPLGFNIKTNSSFPMKAGIASSASFFSAITFSYFKALSYDISEKKLSIATRLSGSGSACRSIPSGFVWWHAGKDSESSYAETIAPQSFWDINDIVVVLSSKEKEISSINGHSNAVTSSLYKYRQKWLSEKTDDIKKAFFSRDIELFGKLVEEEAIFFHACMQTQYPPLLYISNKTTDCFNHILEMRKNGTQAYMTIDAGSNVHIITTSCYTESIISYLNQFVKFEDVIINKPSSGVHVI